MSDRRNWDNCIVSGTRTVKKEGILRIEKEDFKFEGLVNHIGKKVHFEIDRNINSSDYKYRIYTSSTLNSIITSKDF